MLEYTAVNGSLVPAGAPDGDFADVPEDIRAKAEDAVLDCVRAGFPEDAQGISCAVLEGIDSGERRGLAWLAPPAPPKQAIRWPGEVTKLLASGTAENQTALEGGEGLPSVLVVDDNLANLKFVRTQLSDSYRVSMAKSGPQALSMASKNVPDLILLDIDMPGMDGFETMELLKRHEILRRVPVIYLTANRDTETELKALASGAKDFVTKPFEKDILRHRISLHIRFNHYQQHLEDTVKELEDSMVTSFSGLIECRDGNTGGHVVRTRQYVALLGSFLVDKGLFPEELNRRELELIARAAPLHDIGKIGVSDAILLKESKLTDEEYEQMKAHTTIGAGIIDRMYRRAPTQHYLNYARKIAESHHERWDGRGYPNGLAAEEIPLCSRIMAVADVYDALVEDRIYRPALPHEEAMRIMTEARGAIFDPVLLDVFAENGAAFRTH
jgi:putative two-component system response regulator